MAVASLSTKAVEESSYAITMAFTDEEGDSAAPSTLTWTLTDELGNVINEKEEEAVSSPSSSETVLLQGDDLSIQSHEVSYPEVKRIFTCEATYDSETLGSGLPLKSSVVFDLINLRVVT